MAGNGRSGPPLIGVLALQGDFAAHAATLERFGARTRLVRAARDFAGLEGLVMPGGESTTMLRLLERNGLGAALTTLVSERPTLATCAGVILLAREVTGPQQDSLGLLDVSLKRNGYGRQVDSFIGPVVADRLGGTIEGVFIRAPRLCRVGPRVTILGRLGPELGAELAGEPVLVEEGHIVGATFHPELTAGARVHHYFLTRHFADRVGAGVAMVEGAAP